MASEQDQSQKTTENLEEVQEQTKLQDSNVSIMEKQLAIIKMANALGLPNDDLKSLVESHMENIKLYRNDQLMIRSSFRDSEETRESIRKIDVVNNDLGKKIAEENAILDKIIDRMTSRQQSRRDQVR